MINLNDFINEPPNWLRYQIDQPWDIIINLEEKLKNAIDPISNDYNIIDGAMVHKTAIIEQGVILKGKIIISENCFIGANAYLRGPIFIGSNVNIGAGSEIKQSIILNNSAIAHFNYIGNSIIGKSVNFEAGSICANHYNERKIKNIFVTINNEIIDTKIDKFGSLVGDNSRIGANAVLSPGTILKTDSIVKRLELIEQIKEND
ncbi:DapH/DapD/GlmU-related protein [Flavobacterium restrictum]|uniref:LpxA family transferase n=1 Tax=Flavobacterium restrictum TaxID=2594428 RepID=A0A553E3I9_9FLAO|nr:DapH/DapD/GlmU-related protein [Flavobacterium restrictum]TRX39473.1 LpxA family transferase [Flavobacterium restrictum]